MEENRIRKAFQNDRLARFLGIEILEIKPGYARTALRVNQNMLNSLAMTHGSAIFALADMAFAVACNSHGTAAVALSVNINFMKATGEGSLLTATAEEECRTSRTGVYRITIENEKGEKIASAVGTAYRTGRPLPGCNL